MLDNGKISWKQITLLIVLARFILTLSFLPFFSAPPKNQDLWISTILSFPLQLMVALPIFIIAKRFPNMSLIHVLKSYLGKFGSFIGFLYAWFFLHSSALTLREFGEFLTTSPYPETPIIVFMSISILFAIPTVRYGIEVIGRIAEIIFPIIIFSVFLVVVLLAKDMDFKQVFPICEDGILPIVSGAFILASRTKEFLFIGFLMPFIKNSKNIKKSIIYASIILSLSSAIISLIVLTTFGIEEAKNRTFAFYSAVRLICVGNFFERIDAIYIGIWVLGIFVRVAIYYYLTVIVTAWTLDLKDYQPLILPIGAIIVSLSILMADNIVELEEFLSYKIYTWYQLLFSVAIPMLFLLFMAIKKKEPKKT